jgi:hypothetical protein
MLLVRASKQCEELTSNFRDKVHNKEENIEKLVNIRCSRSLSYVM